MISESKIEETLKGLFENLRFTAEPAGLYDPLRYMIDIGGKRIRPRLCLLCYSLFKDELNEDILTPAAAIEVFHSFTLIHDDIMDKADVRRGVPTVCRKWDDNTAILSGDVMSIESFRMMSRAPRAVLPEVLELFTRTAAEVCEGQQYDMDFENRKQVSMEEYISMVGLKTAVLIACSAKIGALIGGADQKTADVLYAFAYDLGLAFQIADDYLDTFGDTKVFGKAIGGDISNNKKTWLLTKAIEKAADVSELDAAMAMEIPTEEARQEKIERVKNIYVNLGVNEDAKNEIAALHARAMSHIESLDLGNVRTEALRRYAATLLGRTK